MSLIEYRLHIGSADSASELHEIRGLARVDGQLSDAEKLAVDEAVGRKFSAMNRAAIGDRKPRWS